MNTSIQLIPADTQLFSRAHAHLTKGYIAPFAVVGPGKLKIPLGIGSSKEEFSIQICAQDNGVSIKILLSIYALSQLLSEPVAGGALTPTLYQLLPLWFPSCAIDTESWTVMSITSFHTSWSNELIQVLDNAMKLSGIPAVWQGA